MDTTLFLFAIGPVKPFIENSRKARDLYAGSYLLSYLMKEVIKELHNRDARLKIVFPLEAQSNVPNRLIAQVDQYSQTEKEQLGQQISKFVQQRFVDICRNVFSASNVSPNPMAMQQIEHFLEVYWVFEQQPTYELAYKYINASLNNIKRLRYFKQMNEPVGRKCDLYPEYNAIIVKRRANGMLPSFVDASSAIDVTNIGTCKYALKLGEGLSAIAFVKRMLHLLHVKELPDYKLNISSVAYMLLKNSLGEEKYNELPLLQNEASEALFDLQNGQQLSTDEYSLEHIRIAQALNQQISLSSVRTSPYYAIVKFDGDGMGQVYNDYADQQIQEKLSKETSQFSNEVRRIIVEQGGICIYAGGEDFLGFLPLDKLFQTMYELRQDFLANVKAPVSYGKPLTFSAGIVIAHLMQPLNRILAKTGDMEKRAKESFADKNAFAIGLVKRSGDQLVFQSSFGNDGKILLLINQVIVSLAQKEYSKSFVYNLNQTLTRLGSVKSDNKQRIIQVLIEQALQQSTSLLTKDEFNQQSSMLYQLFLDFESDVERFQSFLQFVAFVSREVN